MNTIAPPNSPGPTSVRVIMYQVGFGDCFLLSFTYPAPLDDGRSERHVLIDFGSTRRPPSHVELGDVAPLIAQHSNGQLDAVVVTHRHRDHMSGFGGSETGKVIDGLHPKLVVRPWTEDPEAAADANAPGSPGDRSRELARGLRAATEIASEVSQMPAKGRGVAAAAQRLASFQLGNQDAIDRLDAWAAAGDAAFAYYGSDSHLAPLLPGVEVDVLGPPTVEQWPEVAGQRADDPEYWLAYRSLLETIGDLPEASALVGEQGERRALADERTRWLVERIDRQQLSSLLRVVHAVDDALNNTSLILLFRTGTRRLLFSGDAQIENWRYALTGADDADEMRQLLSLVDLYKVGHHGSRNGTPRTLFGLWSGAAAAGREMTTLLSTLGGVHGESEATRVPRATLVAALRAVSVLHATEDLEEAADHIALTGDTATTAVFSP